MEQSDLSDSPNQHFKEDPHVKRGDNRLNGSIDGYSSEITQQDSINRSVDTKVSNKELISLLTNQNESAAIKLGPAVQRESNQTLSKSFGYIPSNFINDDKIGDDINVSIRRLQNREIAKQATRGIEKPQKECQKKETLDNHTKAYDVEDLDKKEPILAIKKNRTAKQSSLGIQHLQKSVPEKGSSTTNKHLDFLFQKLPSGDSQDEKTFKNSQQSQIDFPRLTQQRSTNYSDHSALSKKSSKQEEALKITEEKPVLTKKKYKNKAGLAHLSSFHQGNMHFVKQNITIKSLNPHTIGVVGQKSLSSIARCDEIASSQEKTFRDLLNRSLSKELRSQEYIYGYSEGSFQYNIPSENGGDIPLMTSLQQKKQIEESRKYHKDERNSNQDIGRMRRNKSLNYNQSSGME